jgi:hypothetical protein
VGYIVNVNDALNYDIDLFLPAEISSLYSSVIRDDYYFKSLSLEYFTNGEFDNNEINRSSYHKCRLKSVIKNKNNRKTLNNEVKKLIDRVDGWIYYTISDIDIYQRLIIDIELFFNDESQMNLSQYILREGGRNLLYIEYINREIKF